MYALIVQELRRTLRHAALREFFFLLFLGEAGLIFYEIRRPDGNAWFSAAFRIALFFGILGVLALFCARWQRERGDASLDPALTTHLAPGEIVLGRFAALFGLIALVSLAGSAVDFRGAATVAHWKRFAQDAASSGVLVSFIVALGALPRKSSPHPAWSGIASVLLALALMIAGLGDKLALLAPQLAKAGALERLLPLETGLTVLGLLVAEAGLAKPASDRAAKLHAFFVAAAAVMPLWLWKTGAEDLSGLFRNCFLAAATVFMLASLCEREKRTLLQQKRGGFRLFTTGGFPAWCWSVAFAAAGFFAAPRTEAFLADFGIWILLGFYVALVRAAGFKSTVVRIAAFGTVVFLAHVPALWADKEPLLAAFSCSFAGYLDFSFLRFGVVFVVSVLLRAKEFAAFFRRENA